LRKNHDKSYQLNTIESHAGTLLNQHTPLVNY